MRSEAKKSFQQGFELTEQELRRIYDVMSQQISRVVNSPKSSFEIKFRNGVISEPLTLDEIFQLENIGSGAIERLQVQISDGADKPEYSIKIEFINTASEAESGTDSIKYTVIGSDNNWVFVTSSQIEERISRVKRFAFNRLLKLEGGIGILTIFPLIAMLIPIITIFSRIGNVELSTSQKIDAIELQWQNGTLKDPVEVMIALERMQNERNNPDLFSTKGFFFPMIISIVGIVLLVIALVSSSYFFPSHVFLWGDYVRFIQKRKATGSFIYGGIVLAIIVSILANYLSVLLGIGK